MVTHLTHVPLTHFHLCNEIQRLHNTQGTPHCRQNTPGPGTVAFQPYHDAYILLLFLGVKHRVCAVQRPQNRVQQQFVFGQSLPRLTDEINQLQPVTLLLPLSPLTCIYSNT